MRLSSSPAGFLVPKKSLPQYIISVNGNVTVYSIFPLVLNTSAFFARGKDMGIAEV